MSKSNRKVRQIQAFSSKIFKKEQPQSKKIVKVVLICRIEGYVKFTQVSQFTPNSRLQHKLGTTVEHAN